MPNINCQHDERAVLTDTEALEHFEECLTLGEQRTRLLQWRQAAHRWQDHQTAEFYRPADAEANGYLTQTFAPHFMGVVVGVPAQTGGQVQLYTFSRSGYGGEPITGVDRMIVDALLTHAKNALYSQGQPAVAPQAIYPQPYNPGF